MRTSRRRCICDGGGEEDGGCRAGASSFSGEVDGDNDDGDNEDGRAALMPLTTEDSENREEMTTDDGRGVVMTGDVFRRRIGKSTREEITKKWWMTTRWWK